MTSHQTSIVMNEVFQEHVGQFCENIGIKNYGMVKYDPLYMITYMNMNS